MNKIMIMVKNLNNCKVRKEPLIIQSDYTLEQFKKLEQRVIDEIVNLIIVGAGDDEWTGIDFK